MNKKELMAVLETVPDDVEIHMYDYDSCQVRGIYDLSERDVMSWVSFGGFVQLSLVEHPGEEPTGKMWVIT